MEYLERQSPSSPIQRILIFHLHLYERCMDGKPLSESASEEEISEQILYYHRERRPLTGDSSSKKSYESSTREDAEPPSQSQEAINFLGLCTALYSLPSSMGAVEDRTQEIYFGNASLVFLSLEGTTELLAVAEVARFTKQWKESLPVGGANPLAIRRSIEQCHRLFCLLRGGGIMNRLWQTTSDSECPCPSMSELFGSLRLLRKINEKIERAQDERESSLLNEKRLIQERIKALRKSLPIQKLRRDLDVHYRQYLGDLGIVAERNGGPGRCVVEHIPAPIAQDSLEYATQSHPLHLSSDASASMEHSIRKLLLASTGNSSPKLLGVVTFHEGQFLHTILSDRSLCTSLHGFRDLSASYTVKESTVCSIMQHMASHRMKMRLLARSAPMASAPNRIGLKRLALTIGSIADGTPQRFDLTSSTSPSSDGPVRGGYLQPPPAFMLDESDHAPFFKSRSGSPVWSPEIWLPVVVQADDSVSDCTVETRVVLYEHDGFDFLLLLSDISEQPDSIEETGSSTGDISSFLVNTRGALVEAVVSASQEANVLMEEPDHTVVIAEPGQDVISVDRISHRLVLYSDRKRVLTANGVGWKAGKATQPRRFFGLGSRKPLPVTKEKSNGDDILEWASLGLDCRHLLASHLHLDVILAFDDMMNQVAFRRSQHDSSATSSFTLEICTCMTLGWIYAHCMDNEELYVYFDNSTYVTVADVQIAARRIRSKLAPSCSFSSEETNL